VHHRSVTEKDQGKGTDDGRKAVFRIPGTAYLAIIFLIVCVTPTAFGGVPGLQVIYLVPILLFVFVLRTRTVATPAGLTVRTMFGKRELPWAALKGLALTNKSKVRAVLQDESQITLPTVRTRHLPVLSLISEGRLKDPSGVLDEDRSNDLSEDARKDSQKGDQGGE
jgi:hypothetical protein